jgi:methionyl aminopeptidase
MITLKKPDEIELMRAAGRVTGQILYDLRNIIKPGISTKDIDRFVEGAILEAGMKPTFKGLYGFPASACVSLNEEIIHGIPDEKRFLKEGDIVSVDTGATYRGWVSDAARTYAVGAISEEARHIVKICRESFFAGLKYCFAGNKLGDVESAIQQKAESEGFSVVRDFVGHGLGRELHEDPQVKNYGKAGKGPSLMKGMTLAIEPMINAGSFEVEFLADNFTAVTTDGRLSAHYENTVLITDGEPELLTLDPRDNEGE